MCRIGKAIRTESRLVRFPGLGNWGERKMTANGYRVYSVVIENILKFIGVMDVQLCEHTRNTGYSSLNG